METTVESETSNRGTATEEGKSPDETKNAKSLNAGGIWCINL